MVDSKITEKILENFDHEFLEDNANTDLIELEQNTALSEIANLLDLVDEIIPTEIDPLTGEVTDFIIGHKTSIKINPVIAGDRKTLERYASHLDTGVIRVGFWRDGVSDAFFAPEDGLVKDPRSKTYKTPQGLYTDQAAGRSYMNTDDSAGEQRGYAVGAHNAYFHIEGDQVLFNFVQGERPRAINKDALGNRAYGNLKRNLSSKSGINSAEGFKMTAAYDAKMSGFKKLETDLKAGVFDADIKHYDSNGYCYDEATQAGISIDLKEFIDPSYGTDEQNFDRALMTMICLGYLKDVYYIDFENGIIQFLKEDQDKAVSAIRDIFRVDLSSEYKETKRYQASVAVTSLTYYLHEGKTKDTIEGDEAHFRAGWAYSAYYMFMGLDDGAAVEGAAASEGGTESISGVSFGNFNEEITRMQAQSTDQNQFVYYVLSNTDGNTAFELLHQPNPQNQNDTIPFRGLGQLDTKLAEVTTPSANQEGTFLEQPKNQEEVRFSLAGYEQQTLLIEPSSNYFFTYTTPTGKQFRVLRVPVANRKSVSSDNHQALGYMTFDALSFYSNVFNVGSETGLSSSLCIDGNQPTTSFTLGETPETAYYYKSNTQKVTISQNIVGLAFALQELGAAFDIKEDMSADEVFDKLLTFFEDDDNDHEFVPDGEFNDPDSWVDPQNRTVMFAGQELPYKLAMYLAAMSVQFSSSSDKIGENFLDIQQRGMDKGAQLQYLFMGFILVSGVFQVIASIRAQKKLYKEAMSTQLVEDAAAKDIAKQMMRNPHWCPDFMSPMFDPREISDPNPYFTTEEREVQIRQVMEALTGGAFSAAFVLGEAGVGKTELMREVQRRLLLPQQEALALGVPRELLGKIIYVVDPNKWDARMGVMGSGSRVLAEFILFMKRNTNAIAFFDEATMLTSSGLWGGGNGQDVQGNTPFEKMLPYLSDKELYAVFATTRPEYDEYFRDSPRFGAFLRRMEKVELNIFDVDEVKAALATIYPQLLEKYRVISLDTNEETVTIRLPKKDGSFEEYIVPKIISDLVDAVRGEPYVLDHPNVLMDFSIKRLRILVEKSIRDVIEYNTNPTRGRAVLSGRVDHEIGELLRRREELKKERTKIKSEIDVGLVRSESFFRDAYDYLHRTPEIIERMPPKVRTAVKTTILMGLGIGSSYAGISGLEEWGDLVGRDGLALGAGVYVGMRGFNVLLNGTTWGKTFKRWVKNTPLKKMYDKLFKNVPFWESELDRVNTELNEIESVLFEKGGDPAIKPLLEQRLASVRKEIELIEAKLNGSNLSEPELLIAEEEYKKHYGENGTVKQLEQRLDEVTEELQRCEEELTKLEQKLAAGEDVKAEFERLLQQFKEIREEYALINRKLAQHKIDKEILLYKTGRKTLSEVDRAGLEERKKKLEKRAEEYQDTIDRLDAQKDSHGIVLGAKAWAAYSEEILTEAAAEDELERYRDFFKIIPGINRGKLDKAKTPEAVLKLTLDHLRTFQEHISGTNIHAHVQMMIASNMMTGEQAAELGSIYTEADSVQVALNALERTVDGRIIFSCVNSVIMARLHAIHSNSPQMPLADIINEVIGRDGVSEEQRTAIRSALKIKAPTATDRGGAKATRDVPARRDAAPKAEPTAPRDAAPKAEPTAPRDAAPKAEPLSLDRVDPSTMEYPPVDEAKSDVKIDRDTRLEDLLRADEKMFPGAAERLSRLPLEKVIERQLEMLSRKAQTNPHFKAYVILYYDYIALSRALTEEYAPIREAMLTSLFMETHYAIQEQKISGERNIRYPTYEDIRERHASRMFEEATNRREIDLWRRASEALDRDREDRVEREIKRARDRR